VSTGTKSRRYLLSLPWPLGILALLGVFALASWLRRCEFSSEFVLFAYLQIVGTLLCFTFVANALVRFRGTRDRLTLILALGFVLAGLIETLAIFKSYWPMLAAAEQAHVPTAWMIGRTLLAVLVLAALALERGVPFSRDPGRETALAFFAVGLLAYLTSAAYLGTAFEPVIHPLGRLARPWDLLPAALFLLAAIGFGGRPLVEKTSFDRAICAALWLNVACHVAATQSTRTLDAPFALAQGLRVISYAVALGGTLLDNARLFDQVRRLAVSDSLTGLGNYRTFQNVLEGEIQRSQRNGRSFALLLMDLDGLKQINDRYGHLVGSRAICRLANVLRVHCRAMDTAARYGGDEFALVLPEAGAQAAQRVAQRICERLKADGQVPPVTVSIGAAVFPQDGRTAEELLNTADRALYGMKRGSDVMALTRIAACL
jgi:diguanylate cyclase (GGDEF)-like protein